MTGLDILKKVLIEDYGCTKQQANAPVVEKVITAMAENSGLIEKCTVNMFEESKRRLKEAEITLGNSTMKLCMAENYNRHTKEKEEELKREKEEFIKWKDETEEKILSMETPEARDQLRKATIYERMVEVTNGYERTAYIKGLGYILASPNTRIEVNDE